MKYLVVDNRTGNGISIFNTAREAGMFQYTEKIYLTTSVVEVESAEEIAERDKKMLDRLRNL